MAVRQKLTSVAKLLVGENCAHREGHLGPVGSYFPSIPELGQQARVIGVQQLYSFQASVKSLVYLKLTLQDGETS